jgi:predicted nucleic acid-binding protein
MTDRVLVDTNVLIAAVDSARPGHIEAQELIEGDPRALAVTGQIMREFLVVMTRPVAVNGYGVRGDSAVAVWSEITSTLDLLDEGVGSQQLLRTFVADGRALGKQVHDAQLVAVAVDRAATSIVTANRRHFERFADLLTIEDLVP